MTSKKIGGIAEDLATKILITNNFKIITRNFRSRSGEIDIICFRNNTISFVEVKSLSMFKQNFLYEPKEQITHNKKFKIMTTAKYFITKNNFHNLYYKFDLMEIKFWKNNKYSYNYIENIF